MTHQNILGSNPDTMCLYSALECETSRDSNGNWWMPTYVRTDRCDGCKGRDEPACVHICPHDLMKLDIDGTRTGHVMKAWNQEPEQCWECYACVKSCPRHAVEVRHYADIVPLGASVQPVQGSESIRWTVKFRNGIVKRFEFPIRTTPDGSVDPYGATPNPLMEEVADHSTLFTKSTHACDVSQFIEG